MNTSMFDNDVYMLWMIDDIELECESNNIEWDASDKLMDILW